MNPRELAEKIVATLGTVEGVSKIEIAGPGFINFHLASSALADSLKSATETDMWGANEDLKGKKIMVEYTDPNPFKEFHIGHLMRNAIGESIVTPFAIFRRRSEARELSGRCRAACGQSDLGA